MSDYLAAKGLISEAGRIVIFSGAGLSAESGIPTYRDSGGLWTNPENLQYSSAAGISKDPAGALSWFAARRKEMRQARPNPAHLAIGRLQKSKPAVTVVTQNIDGLLTQAGCVAVIELHGSIHRNRCVDCNRKSAVRRWFLPKTCLCGGALRPDVVLFDEMLNEDVLLAAQQATRKCDVFITVGTSGNVYPAAQLPGLALTFNAKLIVVNAEDTLLGKAADINLVGPAGEVLPLIL